jgi:lysine biosynthesis protein LysW
MAGVKKVKCPKCQDTFELDDYIEEGETTFCPSCDAELKIIRLDPPLVEALESYLDEGEDDQVEDDIDETGHEF